MPRFLRFRARPPLWCIWLAAFLGVFFWAMHDSYPIIGHDYLVFLPPLLAGRWHFIRQGFAPFRYIPHICGGIPEFGDPQSLFYSPIQVLMLFVDPWIAIQITFGLTLLLAYWGWLRFGRDILRWSSAWAHLLALLVIANGFYLVHSVVGHLSYYTTPLVGLLLWMLLRHEREEAMVLILRSCIFGLVVAALLYGGQYFTLMLTSVAVVVASPLDLLLHKHEWKNRALLLLRRFVLFGIVAVLLCLSKFVAVWSFMRFFPREYAFDRFSDPGMSALLFLVRSLWAFPQRMDLFIDSGAPWALHETSMFLSPVTLIGLLLGITIFFKKRLPKTEIVHWILILLYTLFVFTLFAQLTRGYGFLVTPLETLPIFSTFHVMHRFSYLLSLFVSVIAIQCLITVVHDYNIQKHTLLITSLCSLITVFALVPAYRSALQSRELPRFVAYDEVRRDMESSEYLEREVTDVHAHDRSDIEHVLWGSTGITCYEPLFGYRNEHLVTSLVAGPVSAEQEGYFNLNNPACLQYPEENNCTPGDRISVEDRENFERFRSGERTSWKTSRLQRSADALTLVTLFGCLALCFCALIKKLLQHLSQH